MNIEKILKKLGFDPMVINDKQLRIEFISLIEIFLDKYQLYGDVHDKNAYQVVSIDGNNAGYSVREDCTKQCRTISAFDELTNKEYDLDVIYDRFSKTYKVIFKPLTLEGFSHNLFGNSFFIEYNSICQKMTASMVSKTFDCNLLIDKYEFDKISIKALSDNNSNINTRVLSLVDPKVNHEALLVSNTKSVYEGLSVMDFETKYLDLNNLYRPGEVDNCELLNLKSRTTILSTNSTFPFQNTIRDNVLRRFAIVNMKNCSIVYRHGENICYRRRNSSQRKSLLSNMIVTDYSCKKEGITRQKTYN